MLVLENKLRCPTRVIGRDDEVEIGWHNQYPSRRRARDRECVVFYRLRSAAKTQLPCCSLILADLASTHGGIRPILSRNDHGIQFICELFVEWGVVILWSKADAHRRRRPIDRWRLPRESAIIRVIETTSNFSSLGSSQNLRQAVRGFDSMS